MPDQSNVRSLGGLVEQVIQSGEGHVLSHEEKHQFYKQFSDGISSEIQKIRDDQCLNFEQCKQITLK